MATRDLIGWIGAGRMGVPMAGFILKAGYPVLVSSRTAASRARLVQRGAREVASPAECARAAGLVFTCVPDDEALREVALGPEGVLEHARPGTILADTSTVSIELSAEIGQPVRSPRSSPGPRPRGTPPGPWSRPSARRRFTSAPARRPGS